MTALFSILQFLTLGWRGVFGPWFSSPGTPEFSIRVFPRAHISYIIFLKTTNCIHVNIKALTMLKDSLCMVVEEEFK
mgnify:CR=1 FL=1